LFSVSTAYLKTCCMDYSCSAFLCSRSSQPSSYRHLSHHIHPHLFTLCFLSSLYLFYRGHRRSDFTASFLALPRPLFCLLSFPICLYFYFYLFLSLSGLILSVLLVTVIVTAIIGSLRCGHMDLSSRVAVVICIGCTSGCILIEGMGTSAITHMELDKPQVFRSSQSTMAHSLEGDGKVWGRALTQL
jgi:hypothetical protein